MITGSLKIILKILLSLGVLITYVLFCVVILEKDFSFFVPAGILCLFIGLWVVEYGKTPRKIQPNQMYRWYGTTSNGTILLSKLETSWRNDNEYVEQDFAEYQLVGFKIPNTLELKDDCVLEISGNDVFLMKYSQANKFLNRQLVY